MVTWSAPSILGGDPLNPATCSPPPRGAAPMTTKDQEGAHSGHDRWPHQTGPLHASSSLHRRPGVRTRATAPAHRHPPSAALPTASRSSPTAPATFVATWSARSTPAPARSRLLGHHPGETESRRLLEPDRLADRHHRRGHGHHHLPHRPRWPPLLRRLGAAISAAGPGTAAITDQPVTPRSAGRVHVVLTQAPWMPWPPMTPPDPGLALARTLPANFVVIGDILVGPLSRPAPNGLIATVTGVTNTSAPMWSLPRRPAVGRVFTNLSFGYTGTRCPCGHPPSRPRPPVPLHPTPGPGSTSPGHTFSRQSRLRPRRCHGQVNLTANVKMDAEVHTPLPDPPMVFDVRVSHGGRPPPDSTPPISGSKSWQIGEIDSPPIDIQAGPVPILLSRRSRCS